MKCNQTQGTYWSVAHHKSKVWKVHEFFWFLQEKQKWNGKGFSCHKVMVISPKLLGDDFSFLSIEISSTVKVDLFHLLEDRTTHRSNYMDAHAKEFTQFFLLSFWGGHKWTNLLRGQRTGSPSQRVFEPPFSLHFLNGTQSFMFQWELLCPAALVRRFCSAPWGVQMRVEVNVTSRHGIEQGSVRKE